MRVIPIEGLAALILKAVGRTGKRYSSPEGYRFLFGETLKQFAPYAIIVTTSDGDPFKEAWIWHFG